MGWNLKRCIIILSPSAPQKDTVYDSCPQRGMKSNYIFHRGSKGAIDLPRQFRHHQRAYPVLWLFKWNEAANIVWFMYAAKACLEIILQMLNVLQSNNRITALHLALGWIRNNTHPQSRKNKSLMRSDVSPISNRSIICLFRKCYMLCVFCLEN